jgi:hypothetical protein
MYFGMRGIRDSLAKTRWRVLRATDEEFIVPDHPPNVGLMPVTPTLCLYGVEGDGLISPTQV